MRMPTVARRGSALTIALLFSQLAFAQNGNGYKAMADAIDLAMFAPKPQTKR